MNRDKRALINSLWKCKKGERLTITANLFTKIDQLDGPSAVAVRMRKILPAPETNQLQHLLNSPGSGAEKKKCMVKKGDGPYRVYSKSV